MLVSLETSISQNSRLGSLERSHVCCAFIGKGWACERSHVCCSFISKDYAQDQQSLLYIINKLEEHTRTGMIMIKLSLFPTQWHHILSVGSCKWRKWFLILSMIPSTSLLSRAYLNCSSELHAGRRLRYFGLGCLMWGLQWGWVLVSSILAQCDASSCSTAPTSSRWLRRCWARSGRVAAIISRRPR